MVNSPSKKDEAALRKIRNKILQRRMNTDQLEKEEAQFQEIRTLLERKDSVIKEVEVPVASSSTAAPPTADDVVVPLDSLPSVQILQRNLAFSIYTEESLDPAKFFSPDVSVCGVTLADDPQKRFLDLLSKDIFELVPLPKAHTESISKYVFYLVAVSKRPDLIRSGLKSLQRFSSALTIEDVLPVFANFGADPTALCGKDISIPAFLVPGSERREDFPLRNIEAVLSHLAVCVEKGLLPHNTSARPLVVALVNLISDSRVRYSQLVPHISNLLTRLCVACEATVGAAEVATWLHQPHLQLPTQSDICRVALRPQALSVQHSLIIRIVKSILKSRLASRTPIQAGDVVLILKRCHSKLKTLSVTELLTILQLLISALPHITAKTEDIQQINGALSTIEAQFTVNHSLSDLTLLRANTTKLKSLLAIRRGLRF